jgi:hypothetical protein
VDQDNTTVLHATSKPGIKDPHYNARPNNVPNHVTTQWRQPCFSYSLLEKKILFLVIRNIDEAFFPI